MRALLQQCLPKLKNAGPSLEARKIQVGSSGMAIIKLTQVIQRPVEEVFRTVIDVADFPLWNPTTPTARKVTAGETGEGTKFDLEIKGFGTVLQELQEFQAKQTGPPGSAVQNARGRASIFIHGGRRLHACRSRARNDSQGSLQDFDTDHGNDRQEEPSRHGEGVAGLLGRQETVRYSTSATTTKTVRILG